jgi:hypothetical protein
MVGLDRTGVATKFDVNGSPRSPLRYSVTAARGWSTPIPLCSSACSGRDREFESLYPSKRFLAGRHCRLAEPGRPTGSCPRILCFEHLEGTCAPAGRPRRMPGASGSLHHTPSRNVGAIATTSPLR